MLSIKCASWCDACDQPLDLWQPIGFCSFDPLDSAAELIGSRFNFYANRANLNASIGCEPSQFSDRLAR